MICRYCDKPVENGVTTHSYWNAIPFLCHAECKDAGYKQEAYECQVLDADCNDCKHFQRGPMLSKGAWEGVCLKDNTPTKAYPNFASCHPCFEHRRQPA